MSLYRKYRPQTFEDVVGQDHVARTLRNALTADPPRVAHAYLFTGPRGIGKTTNARLLAKCLNCETGPTPVPCNKCDFCVRVTNNQPTMDLIEIDAASNTGVDNIRETIIDKVGTSPAEGRYRVYIIDEVHMLSNNAFNALLKTLEEPPAHAIFILATTEYHKVPATITSRCQRFDFRRVTPPDIAKRLQYVAGAEQLTLNDDAAKLIARHAEGALRDALTLLEQVSAFSNEEITAADVRMVLGGVPQELIDALVDNIAIGDTHAVLETLELAVDEGASFSQLGRDLTSYLRDLMLLSVGFAGDIGLSNDESATRRRHAQSLGKARLENTLSALREASKEMRDNVDHRLILELTLVRASAGQSAYVTMPVPVPTLVQVPVPVRRDAAPASDAVPVPVPVPAWKTTKPVPVPVPTPQTVVNQPVVAQQEEEAVEEFAPPEAIEESYSDEEMASPVDAVAVEAEPEEEATPIEPEAFTPPEAEVVPEAAPARKKGRRISSFDDLTELWPAVLMRVRKKIGITAVAYLHDARPIGFNDEEIVLEFGKEFHHAKASEASGRLPFEQVISETLDKPRRLKLQLAAPAPKAAPKVEEVADDDDEVDLENDLKSSILDYTQEMFAADIVGRSG